MEAEWKVHVPNLLNEILENPGTGILLRPLQVTGLLLSEVARRAAELNDPELNHLMCRLTLYSVADPENKDYDPEILEKVAARAER